MQSISDLTRASGLIFSGTVLQHGASSVPSVAASDRLFLVRVDRPLRVDPVLGDLRGKSITVVALAPETPASGQQAVFFTNSWIHDRGIAVREVARIDVAQADKVAEAVARLPEEHVLERLSGAALVAHAVVARVGPPKVNRDRQSAWWAPAQLNVAETLKGEPRTTAVVYFATADWPPWKNALRLKEGQRGVFILRLRSDKATRSEAALPDGSLVAVDPGDFQPESQLSQVKKLLGSTP